MDKRKIYLDKIIKVMKDDYPLFKNMELYGFYDQLSNDEMGYVFSGVFGKPVRIKRILNYKIYDENGNEIYIEYSNGDWYKREYDENGNEIYYENSDGLIIDKR